jgi:hypothetical protein
MHATRFAFVAAAAVTAFSTAAQAQDVAPVPAPAPAPAPALALETSDFGRKGQLALDDVLSFRTGWSPGASPLQESLYGGWIGFSTARTELEPTGGRTVRGSLEGTRFWLAPSADYFVLRGLSIGARAQLDISRMENAADTALETKGYGLTLVPRVGYAIPLSDAVTLWPRLGAGYSYYQSETTGTTQPPSEYTRGVWQAEAELGLVVLLGKHGYVNVGPRFSAHFVNAEINGTKEHSSTAVSASAYARLGLVF